MISSGLIIDRVIDGNYIATQSLSQVCSVIAKGKRAALSKVTLKNARKSPLGSGRVIRQSLPLGERSRLVPVSPTTFVTTGIYGFRKSGKSWIMACTPKACNLLEFSATMASAELIAQNDPLLTSEEL
ncbi:hypothetical protein DdX_17500 [Ditylenchus destructor]|uniref:Uncharacterized protein n=1 Tax=Ditylenchus destructor TaxID=166010 RepID=A0AAD4MMH5_9BILA|nr:hypothetical protein DdX_17500 [Ditylenchus destructor]